MRKSLMLRTHSALKSRPCHPSQIYRYCASDGSLFQFTKGDHNGDNVFGESPLVKVSRSDFLAKFSPLPVDPTKSGRDLFNTGLDDLCVRFVFPSETLDNSFRRWFVDLARNRVKPLFYPRENFEGLLIRTDELLKEINKVFW